MMQRIKLFLLASAFLFAGMQAGEPAAQAKGEPDSLKNFAARPWLAPRARSVPFSSVRYLAYAQEPPAPSEEPPVRLKKKKTEPAKPEPVQPAKPEEKKEPPKKEEPKDEPEPPAPQEEDAEVLARVAKNVRLAEEKIANKELGEGTRQLQEDILKDLDALIRSAEGPQGGGGGSDNQNQDQANNGDKSKSSSKPESGPGSMGKGKQQSGRSSRVSRRQSKGSQQAKKNGSPGSGDSQASGQPNDEGKQQQANGKDNNGKNGGGGLDKQPQGSSDKNADLYKDVWGHLPESLRAEMNAYSNDKQFMAKYDELIKRYYRTIAEQGRRKGD